MPPIGKGANLFTAGSSEEAIRWILSAIGIRTIRARVRKLLRRVEEDPSSSRDLLEQHYIELVLGLYTEESGNLSGSGIPEPVVGSALRFCRVAANLDQYLDVSGKRRHRGKLKQAMGEEYGFSALQTEYLAVTTGLQLGCEIDAVDLEGRERFDFVFRRGAEEVEVECKLLTPQSTSSFDLRRFRRFSKLLNTVGMTKLLQSGASHILRLGLEDDLPQTDEGQLQVIEALHRFRVVGEVGDLPNGISLLSAEHWPAGLEVPARAHAEARYLTLKESVATLALNGEDSALVIALLSEPSRDTDARLSYILRGLKRAADQLSRSRSGVLFVELQGPCPDPIVNAAVAADYETVAPRLFESRPHCELVMLNFSGPPFSSGMSFAFRRQLRRKFGLRRSLVDRLEDAARMKAGRSRLPGRDFRREWWSGKYDWSYKSPEELANTVEADVPGRQVLLPNSFSQEGYRSRRKRRDR